MPGVPKSQRSQPAANIRANPARYHVLCPQEGESCNPVTDTGGGVGEAGWDREPDMEVLEARSSAGRRGVTERQG